MYPLQFLHVLTYKLKGIGNMKKKSLASVSLLFHWLLATLFPNQNQLGQASFSICAEYSKHVFWVTQLE